MAIMMNGPLNQLTHSIHKKTWIYSVTKQQCAPRNNSSAVALISTSQYFGLKSKPLNFNFLFIEILLYKINVTLQSC